MLIQTQEECLGTCNQPCLHHYGVFYCPDTAIGCETACQSAFFFCSKKNQCLHMLAHPTVFALILTCFVFIVLMFLSKLFCFKQIISFDPMEEKAYFKAQY